MKTYLVYLLLISLAGSCIRADPKRNWAEKTYGGHPSSDAPFISVSNELLSVIKIREENLDEPIPLKNIFSEFRYVSLESKEDALIGLIDKIIVKSNRIYILDQLQAKSIFIFD